MRKSVTITIPHDDPGRDKGRTYVITEMSASKAEDWALRLALAMSQSGVDIPDDVAKMGMAAIAQAGFKSLGSIKYEQAAPLLQEMMGCVAFVPDVSRPQVSRSPVWEDDIEEVKTRLLLRKEIFKLHTDFLRAASQ